MFKSLKRTEGVSTTDITDRLLQLAENEAGKFYREKQKQQESLSKAKKGR